MVNSSDLVAVMAELHAALAPGDLAQTLRRVTDAAVELLPEVDGATITVEHEEGRLETAAATGSVDADPVEVGLDEDVGAAAELAADTAARLDQLQQALDEGPAVDVVDGSGPLGAFEGEPWGPSGLVPDDLSGIDQAEPVEPIGASVPAAGGAEPGHAPSVRSSDLPHDDRYPTYGAMAASAGVRSQVAVVLFETARSRGVLNLYSLRPGAFDDTVALTDLFAHHSATALAYAADYHDRETAEVERRAVGQALGIVMERYQLAESKAFALLQQTAERRGVSVRLVAQELVAHAEGAGSA